MKNIAFIACALAFLTLSVSGRNDRLRRIHAECQLDPAYYIDESLIKRAMRGEQVDESALGPHVICINVRAGIQSRNGDIIEEGLRTILKERIRNSSDVEDVIRRCGRRNGGTPEEAAVALTRCLHKYARGHH